MIDLVISIVTFNESPSRLAETLNAIHSRKYKLMIIVVDNGSSDYEEVEKTCLSCGAQFIHSKENLGFGRAHNLAFLTAPKGRYNLILNPDLTLAPDTIDKALDYFEHNNDVGLITPKVLNPDGSPQQLMKRNPTFRALLGRFCGFTSYLPSVKKAMDSFEMKDLDPNKQVVLGFATGCCMFIRASIFGRVGGFDSRYFLYFEDADITRSVNEVSSAIYLPSITVTHEWRRANQKLWKYRFIAISSAIRYFRKWGFQF